MFTNRCVKTFSQSVCSSTDVLNHIILYLIINIQYTVLLFILLFTSRDKTVAIVMLGYIIFVQQNFSMVNMKMLYVLTNSANPHGHILILVCTI